MEYTGIFKDARKASCELISMDVIMINSMLLMLADEAVAAIPFILSENEKDLAAMDKADPRYDRLQLSPSRIEDIASDIRNVAALDFPQGKCISEYKSPGGLTIKRISVPFGVVGIIYEARPNVTFDVFSLCVKSGNACILKGGSDAYNSNKAIVKLIKSVLQKCHMNPDVIVLLPAGRKETDQLLNAHGYIDMVIPRGSSELINFVRKNALVPVIETGAGICHTYFDEYGDKKKGRDIITNAKTRRVSVCNALDCLIIHENRLDDLMWLTEKCAEAEVEIFADEKAYCVLNGKYPEHLLKKAVSSSFGTEFLSYKMAVKSVHSFEEALSHIEEFGSGHSEAIITENDERKKAFCTLVDAAAVYTNTSTAFTDGAQFGLGAEIGISTQKLHARGPMALDALTTYKWIIHGDGQIRP